MTEKDVTLAAPRPRPGVDEELLTLQAHLDRPPVLPPPVPPHILPDQAYLEAALLPLLLRGLEALAAARPPDPLAFLAAYLLTNNPQRDGAALRVEPPVAVEASSGGDGGPRPAPLLHRADGTVAAPQELPERAAAYFFGEVLEVNPST